jgi:alpha-D-ribose 1-methylphosphonate 5-triphosphate synthase subunit PhnL
MNEQQTVWVVYEEDRGFGTSIVGVYTDRDVAEEVSNRSNRYYESVVLNAK